MKIKESFKNIKILIFKNISFIKFFFLCIVSFIIIIKNKSRKRIGVVGLPHDNNPGNNLLKFSIFIKLKELGFDPIIIGYSLIKNFYFLKKHVKLKVIKKSFFGLNESDYDILMVNSDQTWNNFSKYEDRLLNYGYLKFAENWTIPRFVYGASLGVNYWKFSDKFDTIVRRLLKKFSGISVREIGAIEIVKKHLGINPELVLDPTLLIDKKYYFKK
jgi:hypothetical protein